MINRGEPSIQTPDSGAVNDAAGREKSSLDAGLGRRAAGGVAWSGVVTIASKAFALLGQIILAWLLLPKDFGLFALAASVGVFVNLLREAGIRQILVQRQQEWAELVGAAFWMSLVLGLLGSALLIVGAPWLSRLLDAPQLAPLLYILAVAAPIDALCTVPHARLLIDLEFRFFALQSIAMSLAQTIATVCLAAAGAGAQSFVWGMLVASLIRCVWSWQRTALRLPLALGIRWWREMLVSSGLITATYLLILIGAQADRLILQWFRSETVVGLYFFALNLSLQTLTITSQQLASVLMPTLSRLQHDPARQRAGFVRSLRMMMLLGVPLCVAQGVLAEPAVRLLFRAEYYDAIVPLRILSICMIFRLAGSSAVSLLHAQGRFSAQAGFTAAQVPLLLLAVTLGAWKGGATGVAIAVTVAAALSEPIMVVMALRGDARRWATSLFVFLQPLLLSLPAFVPAVIIVDVLRVWHMQPLLQLLASSLIALALYVITLRLFARDAWQELAVLVNQLFLDRIRQRVRRRAT